MVGKGLRGAQQVHKPTKLKGIQNFIASLLSRSSWEDAVIQNDRLQ